MLVGCWGLGLFAGHEVCGCNSSTCDRRAFVNIPNYSMLVPELRFPVGKVVLGGSWDLVSKVISTLFGVISSYKYS